MVSCSNNNQDVNNSKYHHCHHQNYLEWMLQYGISVHVVQDNAKSMIKNVSRNKRGRERDPSHAATIGQRGSLPFNNNRIRRRNPTKLERIVPSRWRQDTTNENSNEVILVKRSHAHYRTLLYKTKDPATTPNAIEQSPLPSSPVVTTSENDSNDTRWKAILRCNGNRNHTHKEERPMLPVRQKTDRGLAGYPHNHKDGNMKDINIAAATTEKVEKSDNHQMYSKSQQPKTDSLELLRNKLLLLGINANIQKPERSNVLLNRQETDFVLAEYYNNNKIENNIFVLNAAQNMIGIHNHGRKEGSGSELHQCNMISPPKTEPLDLETIKTYAIDKKRHQQQYLQFRKRTPSPIKVDHINCVMKKDDCDHNNGDNRNDSYTAQAVEKDKIAQSTMRMPSRGELPPGPPHHYVRTDGIRRSHTAQEDEKDEKAQAMIRKPSRGELPPCHPHLVGSGGVRCSCVTRSPAPYFRRLQVPLKQPPESDILFSNKHA